MAFQHDTADAPVAERAPAPAPRISAAKQQMLQLVVTARAALADDATDADCDAMRALFDNTELPFGTVGPDAGRLAGVERCTHGPRLRSGTSPGILSQM